MRDKKKNLAKGRAHSRAFLHSWTCSSFREYWCWISARPDQSWRILAFVVAAAVNPCTWISSGMKIPPSKWHTPDCAWEFLGNMKMKMHEHKSQRSLRCFLSAKRILFRFTSGLPPTSATQCVSAAAERENYNEKELPNPDTKILECKNHKNEDIAPFISFLRVCLFIVVVVVVVVHRCRKWLKPRANGQIQVEKYQFFSFITTDFMISWAIALSYFGNIPNIIHYYIDCIAQSAPFVLPEMTA